MCPAHLFLSHPIEKSRNKKNLPRGSELPAAGAAQDHGANLAWPRPGLATAWELGGRAVSPAPCPRLPGKPRETSGELGLWCVLPFPAVARSGLRGPRGWLLPQVSQSGLNLLNLHWWPVRVPTSGTHVPTKMSVYSCIKRRLFLLSNLNICFDGSEPFVLRSKSIRMSVGLIAVSGLASVTSEQNSVGQCPSGPKLTRLCCREGLSLGWAVVLAPVSGTENTVLIGLSFALMRSTPLSMERIFLRLHKAAR